MSRELFHPLNPLCVDLLTYMWKEWEVCMNRMHSIRSPFSLSSFPVHWTHRGRRTGMQSALNRWHDNSIGQKQWVSLQTRQSAYVHVNLYTAWPFCSRKVQLLIDQNEKKCLKNFVLSSLGIRCWIDSSQAILKNVWVWKKEVNTTSTTRRDFFLFVVYFMKWQTCPYYYYLCLQIESNMMRWCWEKTKVNKTGEYEVTETISNTALNQWEDLWLFVCLLLCYFSVTMNSN